MCKKIEDRPFEAFKATDTEAIAKMSQECRTDFHHVKPVKPLPSRKNGDPVPLIDCFMAPCKGGCPIHQDIPEYVELCRKGMYNEALQVIVAKNALPFITGTICAHRCMNRCSRTFYDESVKIRDTKLLAAEKGYDALMASIKKPAPVEGKKAAIIGGGPTGIAAAYFLGRAGVPCTIFERTGTLGGIVRHVIPEFRISSEAINKDIALMEAYGAEVKLNCEAPSVEELKKQGYTHILYAVGAWKPGKLNIEGNVRGVIGWMEEMKAGNGEKLGHVAVIGGGNTAMDAARVAKRAGAKSSTLVYRRTRKYMPADAEELELAMADGVEFLELVSPKVQKDGKLICDKMKLGEPDASGRRKPVPTGETVEIPCDLVISAVGEQVDSELFKANGIEVDAKGRPAFKTNLENVYAAGDATRGPATVVEGIADASKFAEVVIGEKYSYEIPDEAYPTMEEAVAKKGVLAMAKDVKCEGDRCLACNTVCENCVDVCPNRANVVIRLADGRKEILHVDKMCNECGNCTAFCPYDSEPCKNKFTLFQTERDMDDSKNLGFCFLGDNKVRVRLFNEGVYDLDHNDLPKDIEIFILTVKEKYSYLF